MQVDQWTIEAALATVGHQWPADAFLFSCQAGGEAYWVLLRLPSEWSQLRDSYGRLRSRMLDLGHSTHDEGPREVGAVWAHALAKQMVHGGSQEEKATSAMNAARSWLFALGEGDSRAWKAGPPGEESFIPTLLCVVREGAAEYQFSWEIIEPSMAAPLPN